MSSTASCSSIPMDMEIDGDMVDGNSQGKSSSSVTNSQDFQDDTREQHDPTSSESSSSSDSSDSSDSEDSSGKISTN